MKSAIETQNTQLISVIGELSEKFDDVAAESFKALGMKYCGGLMSVISGGYYKVAHHKEISVVCAHRAKISETAAEALELLGKYRDGIEKKSAAEAGGAGGLGGFGVISSFVESNSSGVEDACDIISELLSAAGGGSEDAEGETKAEVVSSKITNDPAASVALQNTAAPAALSVPQNPMSRLLSGLASANTRMLLPQSREKKGADYYSKKIRAILDDNISHYNGSEVLSGTTEDKAKAPIVELHPCGQCLITNICRCDEVANIGQECKRQARAGDPNRHQKSWSDRIQGKEKANITTGQLKTISDIMKKNGYHGHQLSVRVMRSILSEAKLTSLNDHTTWLIEKLGGTPAPKLTKEEDSVVSARFAYAMELYSQTNDGGNSRRYFPYFMAQIYTEFFKDQPDKLRIVDYIHSQSKETVIKNDQVYKKICEAAGPALAHEHGLVYRPTSFTSYR